MLISKNERIASLTTKFPARTNYIGFMNIQESKSENQDKVRNVPLKMKCTNLVHVPVPRFVRSYKMELQHKRVFGVVLPWKQTCNTKHYILNTNSYQYFSHVRPWSNLKC